MYNRHIHVHCKSFKLLKHVYAQEIWTFTEKALCDTTHKPSPLDKGLADAVELMPVVVLAGDPYILGGSHLKYTLWCHGIPQASGVSSAASAQCRIGPNVGLGTQQLKTLHQF